jgi:DNA-binding LytR/AlgR family response regulator
MDPRTNPENLVFGRQVTYFEEPDIIFLKYKGECTDMEGMEMLRRQRQYAAGREGVFFLIDAEELDGISPAARKAVADTLKDIPLHGMAVYAAPLKAKVLIKLMITAVNLSRKDASANPVEFFATEKSARNWLASRRQDIR